MSHAGLDFPMNFIALKRTSICNHITVQSSKFKLTSIHILRHFNCPLLNIPAPISLELIQLAIRLYILCHFANSKKGGHCNLYANVDQRKQSATLQKGCGGNRLGSYVSRRGRCKLSDQIWNRNYWENIISTEYLSVHVYFSTIYLFFKQCVGFMKIWSALLDQKIKMRDSKSGNKMFILILIYGTNLCWLETFKPFQISYQIIMWIIFWGCFGLPSAPIVCFHLLAKVCYARA